MADRIMLGEQLVAELIQGPQGVSGSNGTNGADGTSGSSAYQIAVANGFVGTEAQWLESLKAPAGNRVFMSTYPGASSIERYKIEQNAGMKVGDYIFFTPSVTGFDSDNTLAVAPSSVWVVSEMPPGSYIHCTPVGIVNRQNRKVPVSDLGMVVAPDWSVLPDNVVFLDGMRLDGVISVQYMGQTDRVIAANTSELLLTFNNLCARDLNRGFIAHSEWAGFEKLQVSGYISSYHSGTVSDVFLTAGSEDIVLKSTAIFYIPLQFEVRSEIGWLKPSDLAT